MAGTGIFGRTITVDFGGTTLAGIITKELTASNSTLDVTDDQSSGWRELMAQFGLRSLDFTASGPVKNLELLAWFVNGGSAMADVTIDWPDGSPGTKLQVEMVMSEYSQSGESNEAATWSATFNSGNAPTLTEGT